MCGIAGYSIRDEQDLPEWVRSHSLGAHTVVARLLLAALAERGADAAGFAASNGQRVVWDKHSGDVSGFLPSVNVPSDTKLAMVHVRDYTKGLPGLAANNHPVRHGSVMCVHNGSIANDDELFAQMGQQRNEPGMTVDSEAIAMLAQALPPEQIPALLVGSYATAWIDERHPAAMMLMRGNGRPLHVCHRPSGVWFASTYEAMTWFSQQMQWHDAVIERVGDGTAMLLSNGRVERGFDFTVNHYQEEPFGGYAWTDPRAIALRDHVLWELRQ
jgi:glucosamine 6-phosphate synthetase-like amidotransferase/phosphosugar isomerase protein